MDKKELRKREADAFLHLLDVMDDLREKCPWDRKQTIESLRPQTIEETFELSDAIMHSDMHNIMKELGDVLLHVVFYSKIGEEKGQFDIADVINLLCDKLIYRHPHVFSSVQVENSAQVMQNWEALKQKEKDGNKTLLAGVPKGMPALPKACRIQQKVSTVGFDWRERSDVWAKVAEEIAEVQAETKNKDAARLEAEFGDLLFAVVNAARLYGVNPDLALERTNRKFVQRFGYMEQQALSRGLTLQSLTPEQYEALWQEAKEALAASENAPTQA